LLRHRHEAYPRPAVPALLHGARRDAAGFPKPVPRGARSGLAAGRPTAGGPPPATAVTPTSWIDGNPLPDEGGQLLKTYDISPFVEEAGPGSQKLVVDWVLQDTGYATWHGEVVASLSADASKLTCYHTEAVQQRVAAVVERFVTDAKAPHRFAIRVLGLKSPSWRADAAPSMVPLPTSTPGVQAWMMPRETAAVLVASLRSRSDCREVPTGRVLAANGQPAAISGGRRRPYVRDIAASPNAWPGWQQLSGACDEGLSVDVQPLVADGGAAVEAIVRCRIDQLERLTPVVVDVPAATQGRVQIEVPQAAAVRVGERFRWPASHTLLVGLGIVPWPVPEPSAGSPALLPSTARRMDVVVVVEPRLSAAP